MTRELIGTAVEIAITQNDAASDDGIIRREADAGFLEKMIEPLARSPAKCIVRMLKYTLRAGPRRRTPFESGCCRCASREQLGDLFPSDVAGIRSEWSKLCGMSQDTLTHIYNTHMPIISVTSSIVILLENII